MMPDHETLRKWLHDYGMCKQGGIDHLEVEHDTDPPSAPCYIYATALLREVLHDADTMAAHAARPEYRVTFGQQYGREGEPPHPRIGAFAHRDGWVTIVADDEADARLVAFTILGQQWSNITPAGEHGDDADLYPLGERLRIIVPPVKAQT